MIAWSKLSWLAWLLVVAVGAAACTGDSDDQDGDLLKAVALQLQSRELAAEGDLEGAIALLDEALLILPDGREQGIAFLDRGQHYLNLGDEAQALIDFDQAIASDRDLPLAYSLRGQTRVAIGSPDVDLILADYNKAIELDPELGAAYINRGDFYLVAGLFEQALADLEIGVQLRPELWIAHHDHGTALLQMGRFEEAIESLTQALVLDPNSAHSSVNLATALGAVGRRSIHNRRKTAGRSP